MPLPLPDSVHLSLIIAAGLVPHCQGNSAEASDSSAVQLLGPGMSLVGGFVGGDPFLFDDSDFIQVSSTRVIVCIIVLHTAEVVQSFLPNKCPISGLQVHPWHSLIARPSMPFCLPPFLPVRQVGSAAREGN